MMGIWIRSQKHESLIYAKIIEYSEYCSFRKGHFILGLSGDGSVILGEYPTKERALEVLDEIEFGILRSGWSIWHYQMPAE